MADESKRLGDVKKQDKRLLLVILFIPCLFVLFEHMDNDIWFLLSHGRYVVANGIPHIEPFTIHQGFQFVMQQWLSAVAFWGVFSVLGSFGVQFLVMLGFMLTVFIVYKLCMKVSDNYFMLSFVVSLAVCFILAWFMVCRPYIFSTPIFVSELYLLESYKKSGSKKPLIFLPLLSVLLVNLHAAMWPILFIILAPYVVETFKFKLGPLKNDGAEKKYLLITIIAIFAAGFINPYGFEAMAYLATSYGYENINTGISEMKPASVKTGMGVVIFISIAAVALIYLKYKGERKLRYILLAAGTAFMALSSMKSLLLFAVCGFFTMAAYLKDFKPELKQKPVTGESLMMRKILIVLTVLMLPVASFAIYDSSKIKTGKYDLLNDTIDYIAVNGDWSEVKLYTDYNDGGLAEFRGLPAYMDARAEVFVKKNNKKDDVLEEYFDLRAGRIYYKDVLDKYNFTHIIVTEGDILLTYLQRDADYKKSYSNEIYTLFELKN